MNCGILVAVVMTLLVQGAAAADAHIRNVMVRTLTTDYRWGLWSGVKQPLGAFKNGLNIHQITKSNYPDEVGKGNPDYIFWVDEDHKTQGVAERPTNGFDGNVPNPGGMAVFDENGTIWYTFGGRAVDLPLDLFRSNAPFDVTSFTRVLDDYETFAASTTPCLHVRDGKVMLFWRHGWSSGSETTVRFRRYDITTGFDSVETELDLGRGAVSKKYGDVGIEQLYTRFDPRDELLFVSWQWFDAPGPMGANPFMHSDDYGATWRRADVTPYDDLPLDFNAVHEETSPYNHIEARETSDWLVADIGVAPGGTRWMTTPTGPVHNWRANFWRYDATEGWQARRLTARILNQGKPHACGATRDFLVFAYAEVTQPNVLKVRVSGDDGDTWSEPVVLDTVDANDTINWVSFVQPADGYPGNRARFFYSHFKTEWGITGQRHRNNIKWVGLDALTADVNDDGVVDFEDLLRLLGAWGECDACREDINGDGIVGFDDMVLFVRFLALGRCLTCR